MIRIFRALFYDKAAGMSSEFPALLRPEVRRVCTYAGEAEQALHAAGRSRRLNQQVRIEPAAVNTNFNMNPQ